MPLVIAKPVLCPRCSYPVDIAAKECGQCHAIFTSKADVRTGRNGDGSGRIFTVLLGLLLVAIGIGLFFLSGLAGVVAAVAGLAYLLSAIAVIASQPGRGRTASITVGISLLVLAFLPLALLSQVCFICK